MDRFGSKRGERKARYRTTAVLPRAINSGGVILGEIKFRNGSEEVLSFAMRPVLPCLTSGESREEHRPLWLSFTSRLQATFVQALAQPDLTCLLESRKNMGGCACISFSLTRKFRESRRNYEIKGISEGAFYAGLLM